MREKINFTQRFNTWLFRSAARRLLFDFSELVYDMTVLPRPKGRTRRITRALIALRADK
jgi:hypothetical protein